MLACFNLNFDIFYALNLKEGAGNHGEIIDPLGFGINIFVFLCI